MKWSPKGHTRHFDVRRDGLTGVHGKRVMSRRVNSMLQYAQDCGCLVLTRLAHIGLSAYIFTGYSLSPLGNPVCNSALTTCKPAC